MSTHNIGFYEDKQNYHLIIIKYHQIRTLFLLLDLPGHSPGSEQSHSCVIYEPRCEKTGLRGFRPSPTQTRLYNHRRWLEARNFVFRN